MSATITIQSLVDALESKLSTAAILKRSQSYNELSETVPDAPLLQVYPESGRTDVEGRNDRSTFQAGVRQKDTIVIADFYAHQRGPSLAEEMTVLTQGISQLDALLDAEGTKPYFGLAGIKAFSWSWERVTLRMGDPKMLYTGARFRVTLRTF